MISPNQKAQAETGEWPFHSRFLACLLFILGASGLDAQEKGKPVSEFPELVTRMQEALSEANPDYQGQGKFVVREGELRTISLMRCQGLTDLSPFARFPLDSVTNVILYNSVNVSDLSPLKGCRKLAALNTERCIKITDLSPLKGLPLTYFRMYACKGVKDLKPLRGMPLKHLDLGLNPLIDDIAVLEGMELTDLRLDNCPRITDIKVVKGMPLKLLSVFGCQGVEDFSPMLELPLESLFFSPELLSEDELEGVQNMKTLKVLGSSWDDYGKKLTPAEFWKRYDESKDE